MKNNAVLKKKELGLSNCRGSYSILTYYIIKVLIMVVTTIFLIIVKDSHQIKWALFYLLALNVYFVIINRKCVYTLIISLFLLWFNYSIYFANYIYGIDGLFTSWAYSDIAVPGYKIVLIFTTVLCVFVRGDSLVENVEMQNDERPKLLNDDQPSYAIWGYCYLVLLTLLLIFGFGRPTESGERGSPSTFYEYSTIVFIVGFYFFGSDKIYKFCSMFLLMLFALQNLLYGGRVTALQLLLLLFIVKYDEKKIPWGKLLPVLVIVLAVFTLVGTMRARVEFTVKNLANSFLKSLNGGYVLDTAYSSYYTSLTFVKVESFVDVKQRLYMFYLFMLSMFLGGSIVKGSNLALFTRQFYTHYYGGVLPFFGQFYLGGFGIVLFGFLVSFYINKMKVATNKSSGLMRCILIYVVATTPRWYLYSPSSLIRGVFLLIIVYYFTIFAIRFGN